MEGSIKKIYLHHKFETFGFFHCILFFVFGVVGLLLHLTVAHSNPIFFSTVFLVVSIRPGIAPFDSLPAVRIPSTWPCFHTGQPVSTA